jgi:hypothetical protein
MSCQDRGGVGRLPILSYASHFVLVGRDKSRRSGLTQVRRFLYSAARTFKH